MRMGYYENCKNRKLELRSALAAFLAQWLFELWVTVTFVSPIRKYTAENRLKKWVGRIEKQERTKIGFYAVYNEVNARHIHVLMLGEGENGRTLKSISPQKWQQNWKRSWGDDVLIKPIYDLPNLGEYLAKNLIIHNPDLSDFWTYNLKPPGEPQREPTSTGTTKSKGDKMFAANQSQEDFNNEEFDRLIKNQAGIRDEEPEDLFMSSKSDVPSPEQHSPEDARNISKELLDGPIQDGTGTSSDNLLTAEIAGLSSGQSESEEPSHNVTPANDGEASPDPKFVTNESHQGADGLFGRPSNEQQQGRHGEPSNLSSSQKFDSPSPEQGESEYSKSTMDTSEDGRIEESQVSSEQTESGRYLIVPIDSLQLDPEQQPRKNYDEESLEKLTETIIQKGILHPLTVRKDENGKLFVVAGSRRLEAARRAGLKKLEVILTEHDPLEVALIENIQRENFRPIEEAEALKRLKEKYDYTDKQLGEIVGKARNTITEILSINKLPEEIKEESRRTDIPKRTLIYWASIRKSEQHLLWNFKQFMKDANPVRANNATGCAIKKRKAAVAVKRRAIMTHL